MSTTPATPSHGGAFLHAATGGPIATPETLSSDHRNFYATASDFVRNEIDPLAEQIDHKKPGLLQALMRKAAELGLFMVEIPEKYEGLGLDKATSMLISEAVASVGAFATTFGAHTGIGTLPLVYYGTDEQKARYLPRLGSGELLAAYCLSEQGSGSDALAAKTTAVLSADGTHYLLNGTKAWVTNGGFADLYTVFAQVIDGDAQKFTAFLVERTMDGVSIGKEERKLGIRGSSTTQVLLDDVRVPVENVLGDVGRGHKIAFNILNIGRWKLGIGAIGGAKHVVGHGIRYAKDRRQFKRPIASFGLIREKFAQAATLIYAGESMAYRTAGLIDGATKLLDPSAPDYGKQAIKIVEEFTIEASILKVFGSEALSTIADEMLQVHGGNGYTEDYVVERFFRDARINRIFEGTNEINRLIVPATIFKRALQGRLPVLQFAQEVGAALLADDLQLPETQGPLANERRATEQVRRAVVFASSYAAQKYLDDLKNKQRILGAIAQAVSCLYGMDSVVSRAQQKVDATDDKSAELHCALASLYCFDARAAVFQNLRRVAMLMAEGAELDSLYANLGKLDQRYRVDIVELQERIVEQMLATDGYNL